MRDVVDFRDAPARPVKAPSGALTEELAACLERFLDGTADEGTMSRARRAMDVWHATHHGGPVAADPRLRAT